MDCRDSTVIPDRPPPMAPFVYTGARLRDASAWTSVAAADVPGQCD